MQKKEYRDFSLISATYVMKYTGILLATNAAEERQKKISILYTAIAFIYGVYVNTVDYYHTSNDLSHRIFLIINTTCIVMTMIKMFILQARRVQIAKILVYAQQHFWNNDYNPQERHIFKMCVKYSTWFVIFVFSVPSTSLTGYVITPIFENLGRNKSDRMLPFKMWVDWPVNETPYYELMFTFQSVCVYIIGMGYVCPDILMCLLNVHAVGQFRILQYRMLNFWNIVCKDSDPEKYTEECYMALKKCIRQHQLIIVFCNMMESVYSTTIFIHVTIVSVLMCLDWYEILLANPGNAMRLIFIFHMLGSLGHLCILTCSCHYMMEESSNIVRAAYGGSWSSLPMNQSGRSLRTAMMFIMIRAMKPCCITAAGFFPVSLETFTTILSSTFSYFTLMRNSFTKDEDE
ncbi:odorant receptor 4-like [Megachile rotundata]|uniref:odorant receptor 4-like n=1 Tax=Megachile rotundata TaxID=143995 RepID=UPI003FD153A6